MSAEFTPWVVFLIAVAALLAMDLGVLGRRGVMSTRTALLWSAVWIGLGLSFALAVWGWLGAVTQVARRSLYLRRIRGQRERTGRVNPGAPTTRLRGNPVSTPPADRLFATISQPKWLGGDGDGRR